MNEDEIRELFAEMRDEPIPVESVVRVRVVVDERIRRRAPWKFAAMIAAFAGLVIAAFVIQMRPAMRKTTNPAVAMRHPAAPAPPVEAPDDLPLTIRPAIERKSLKPRPAPPAQVASIRIETPDPDVVILLVGE